MNKLEKKEYDIKYRLKNRKRLLQQMRLYYRKNKDKILEQQLKYETTKRKIDINYKLRGYLRNRLYQTLKGNYKSMSVLNILGCSIEQLKEHLQKQFTAGMTWNNYGKWHIDHIKPCVSFDLSKPEEQRKCFNYTNLQPLWAEDNFVKNRY